MSIMYDELFLKKFLSNYGIFLFLGYIASFIFLVFVSQRIGVQKGLPYGDFLLKNDEGGVIIFLPFLSSAILAVGEFLVYKIFTFLKGPKIAP